MNKFYFTCLLLCSTSSFAFFCPTNFNQIQEGYSVDQVVSLCGPPASEQKYTKEIDNMPQEWSYYLPQPRALNNFQQMNGTLKTSVVFNADGKAINITVNGIGVSNTTICGSPIAIGYTRDQVRNACGDASFINKQNAPGNSIVGRGSQEKINVTEATYSSTPPVTLIYENGVLKGRK